MKKAFQFVFLILCISACAPTPGPTPIPTSSPTLEPTATPIPEPITGTIFWDANGSGLQDGTSFIFPDFDPEDLPYFFELLSAIGTDITTFSIGDLVTVPEPPIPGMGVCLGEICTDTGSDGSFTIQPVQVQDTYKLSFSDPNADDPVRAFRYINQWNGLVVIDSYEMNGITVPEQHLNDTEIVSLPEGISINKTSQLYIGLTQGYVDFPLSIKGYQQIEMVQGFDQDITDGILDFTGNRFSCSEYNICENMKRSPAQVLNGVGNNHAGIDYGYYGYPDKYRILLYAAKPGFLQVREINGNIDILDFSGQTFGSSTKPIINYGHTSLSLFKDKDFVYTGQVIGIMGNTGTAVDWTHLHFEIQYGKPVENKAIGYSKDFYAQTIPEYIVKDFNDFSSWTVYNIPQFPLVEIVE
jgi:hypothetical protein